jgi:hypothetical protein
MLEMLVVLVLGFSSTPHTADKIDSCQFERGEVCCEWRFTEVGCYEEIDYVEVWCASKGTDYRWTIRSGSLDEPWYEKYVRDSCARCPECCARSDRAELEDVHCASDVCPGPECPCILDGSGVWWMNDTLSFDDEDIENDHKGEENDGR